MGLRDLHGGQLNFTANHFNNIPITPSWPSSFPVQFIAADVYWPHKEAVGVS